jgi:hypothetical protein
VRHAQVQELLGAYAAGAVTDDELAAIETHLAGCRSCREAANRLLEAASLLSYAVPQAVPSAQLRDDVVRAMRHERALDRGKSGRRVVRIAVAACLVALAGAGAVWQALEFTRLRQSVATLSGSLAMQRVLVAQVIPGRLAVLELRPTAVAPGARGTAVLRATRGGQELVLVVTGLPPVAAPSIYQAWLAKDGVRTSAGVFRVDHEGIGVLRYESSTNLSQYQSIGITLEPGGPVPAPRGPRVLGTTI